MDFKVNPVEFGALKQQVLTLERSQAELERRIGGTLSELNIKFGNFIKQYNDDELKRAKAFGYAKGRAGLRQALGTVFLTLVTSGIGTAIVCKVFGLVSPPHG